MTDIARDIGRLDEAVGTLKTEVHGMRQDVTEIRKILDETKGSVRVLLGVASVGGAIGAAFVKGIAFIKGGS